MNKQKFFQVLSALKGTNIGVFFQNGQFVEGVLLDFKSDHLIVDVNNKIFYIEANQVFAFLKNTKDYRVRSSAASYLDRVNFKDVLNSLKYNWVTINGLNNQTFTGLLTTITEDYIMLINDEEQLFIHRPLISNIFNGIYETSDQPITIKKEVVQDSLLDDDNESSNRSETPGEEITEGQTVDQISGNQEQSLIESDLQESPEATNEGLVSILEETSTEDVSSGFGDSPAEDHTSILEGHPTEDNTSMLMLKEESITVNDLNIVGNHLQEHTNGYQEENIENREEADPTGTDMNMNFHEEHLVHKGSCVNELSSDWQLKNSSCLNNSAISNYMWNDIKQKKQAISPTKEEIIKEEDSVSSSKMDPEDKRKMLRMQYYSLMKHAEKMYHQLSDN